MFYTQKQSDTEKFECDDKHAIGMMLKVIRKTHHLSQEELSKLIDVSAQQIHKYEAGKDNIGIDKLRKLSNAFNIDISLFFKLYVDNGTKRITASEKKVVYKGEKASNRNTKEAIELLRNFLLCNDADKLDVLSYVKKKIDAGLKKKK